MCVEKSVLRVESGAKRKYCPLEQGLCTPNCAWYIERESICAVVVLARELYNLRGDIQMLGD
jgi:hypothetical protein